MYLDASPGVAVHEVDGRGDVGRGREAQQEVQLDRVNFIIHYEHLHANGSLILFLSC